MAFGGVFPPGRPGRPGSSLGPGTDLARASLGPRRDAPGRAQANKQHRTGSPFTVAASQTRVALVAVASAHIFSPSLNMRQKRRRRKTLPVCRWKYRVGSEAGGAGSVEAAWSGHQPHWEADRWSLDVGRRSLVTGHWSLATPDRRDKAVAGGGPARCPPICKREVVGHILYGDKIK